MSLMMRECVGRPAIQRSKLDLKLWKKLNYFTQNLQSICLTVFLNYKMRCSFIKTSCTIYKTFIVIISSEKNGRNVLKYEMY